MKQSLTIKLAQKLILLSQRVFAGKPTGSITAATLSAIEHLGYIQIDTISVIQRAHHHTLWNRNPGYEASQLDQLLDEKKVFEYWSHAAAYLPMRDYRFSLPRKYALKTGEQNHWFERDEKLMKHVLARIESEGPLMAKDFDEKGKRTGHWGSKPAKRALEVLFMQGDLMVPGRVNFHKVYDLTERVLHETVDTSCPDPEEYARHLITRYMEANGLGQLAEMAYLRPGPVKKKVASTLQEMVLEGEVLEIDVKGESYYAMPTALDLLNKPLARSRLKILSPFDNLLIQRKRIKEFFGFDYQIECYVPEAKRKYGYFSLPILWDGTFVARMDCKADRKTSVMHIQHLALEPSLKKKDAFLSALRKEMKPFMKFNGCEQVEVHKTTPSKIGSELQALPDYLVL